MKKRHFLKTITTAPLLFRGAFKTLEQLMPAFSDLSAEALAGEESFWMEVRRGYRLKPDYINLESGYYCITPQETLENFLHHVREVNYQGSYYMRTVRVGNKAAVATRLSEILGCSPQEVIVTRNATESLDTVIGGFDWKPGDEAVMAEQDYFAMLEMFRLQAKRHGIINKLVSVPNHPTSDEEIVDLYASAITPRTRLLMVCHIINITGQILPIRKICDMAHSRGVEVMVDGAHAFGHFDFKIADLNCEYYGSSLHKWLSTPLGAGLLYVRKDKVKGLWPLFGDPREPDDILRLNHTGTHPVHTDLAIGNAIDYMERLGLERKEARLRYLQRYWSSKVRDWDGIKVNTPTEPQRSCGIGNVGIEGMKPAEMADRLMKEHRIFTVAIDGAGVHGCRISPNVFTTIKELDIFVEALRMLAKA
ncbi:MAG: aminotransferase class V-fold PLP-dependent enzyme [Saprospiraceae bacterium]|nr:aminotransferase class V-fold PLP-dependent enzyme [Saprospiraceae bacterium]